jgi:deoxyribonuclease-4
MKSNAVTADSPRAKKPLHRLGVHTAIAGGLHRSIAEAREKGCATWQIFSRNPRGWSARPLGQEEIQLFRTTRAESELGPCIIHSSYLINLAANDPEIRRKSVEAFRDEIERGIAIGADYLVVHPGSARGGSVEQAIVNCGAAVSQAAAGLEDRMGRAGFEILIENTAGQGEQIGRTFEQVRDIIEACPGLSVGMCLDTAHSFAAGYDWRDETRSRQAFKQLGQTVGFEKVKAVHFNDSKSAFDSRVDRHWHIGVGEISSVGLARVINHPKLRGLPFILETPQDDDRDDRRNLAAALALVRTK